MYVHYTLCSLSLLAGDSKTTVSTYAAVIRYTTVVKIEALTCFLPVLLDRSEIVLSPANIGASYVGVHPPRVHYRYDDSTLSTTTYKPTTFLTILGIQYDDYAVVIHAILQTPLTILNVLMPLNKSAGTL